MNLFYHNKYVEGYIVPRAAFRSLYTSSYIVYSRSTALVLSSIRKLTFKETAILHSAVSYYVLKVE